VSSCRCDERLQCILALVFVLEQLVSVPCGTDRADRFERGIGKCNKISVLGDVRGSDQGRSPTPRFCQFQIGASGDGAT